MRADGWQEAADERMLQFSTVKLTERTKLVVLMSLHLLWGAVLWFSISKYGLGISTDSVHLLFGGRSLAQGHGLISYDGSFLILWPPLYPALLALVHLATGLDMLAAAGILQAAAFLGLSLCLSILFLHIFPRNFGLALAANVLSDLGVVVLISFDVVGPDYLELMLMMVCVLLTGYYIRYRSPRSIVALAIVTMLAMLNRYLGAAALATGLAAAVFLVGGTLRQRLLRGVFLALAALPASIWLAITSQLYERRDPITFSENFNWFSKSMLEWFFPAQALRPHMDLYIALLWVLIPGLMILMFLIWRRFAAEDDMSHDDSEDSPRVAAALAGPFVAPVFIFGIFYTLALFGAASIAYSNKLGGRFLLPLFIPFATLLVAAVGGLLWRTQPARSITQRLAVQAVAAGALICVGALLLQVTLPIISASHVQGALGGENAFNTREWNQNEVLQYWQSHPPQGDYLLFSNEPDGVAFQTQHAALGSPRRRSGPYGKEIYPLSGYIPELFATGQDVYLLWIESDAPDYIYSVDDLASIAIVEPLFLSADGGLYRLEPKPEA